MGNVTIKTDSDIFNTLREHASSAANRAHVPYSDRATGVALLLSDGCVVPGVRVESASFSLVIPAFMNAVTTAIASSRFDIVAGVISESFKPWHKSYLHGHFNGQLEFVSENAFVTEPTDQLPHPAHLLSPFINADIPSSDREGVALARKVAERAYVPESSFPVGSVALLDDARLVPGVNVEHPNWSSTLCAERNMLGTCQTYGLDQPTALYLSCPDDDMGSPCGACRQLLTELTPTSKLCMDRGDAPPEVVIPTTLLPGSFSGDSIRSKL